MCTEFELVKSVDSGRDASEVLRVSLETEGSKEFTFRSQRESLIFEIDCIEPTGAVPEKLFFGFAEFRFLVAGGAC